MKHFIIVRKVGIFMSKNNDLNYISAFSYLFKLINPHKKWYTTAAVIALLLVCTGLINTRVTQILIDSSVSGQFAKIITALILFALLILANAALNYIKGVCVSKLSANSSRDFKRHMGKILLHGKYKEIIKLQAGDALSSVNSDTRIVCDFIAGDFIGLFSQFTMALGALIYLICINPFLALVTFAYTPMGMFFTLTLNKKMNKLYGSCAYYKGNALSVVEQALSQIPVIKSFMMEKQIKKKIYTQYDNVYKTEMKISVWNSLLQTACSSTSQIPRIIFMIFAAGMVMKGTLTTGAFISIFDLLSYIIGPSVYFPFMLNGLNKSISSINRINKLEHIPQIQNSKETLVQNTVPKINIDNISFGYLKDKLVIQKFSLFHHGCGIIAVCGESGSGKTTLLDIISGLYELESGTIEVTGRLSVVSQDTYLFGMSLIENVRLARINASDEEVIEALKAAGADEFAKALPDGYYTMLGDGNTELSGGEKQRISLARTILSDSQIWLLDEPTSALDVKTESIIIDVINRMSKEKLIIISAHRRSLIDIADRVITLKGAEIIENI